MHPEGTPNVLLECDFQYTGREHCETSDSILKEEIGKVPKH